MSSQTEYRVRGSLRGTGGVRGAQGGAEKQADSLQQGPDPRTLRS